MLAERLEPTRHLYSFHQPGRLQQGRYFIGRIALDVTPRFMGIVSKPYDMAAEENPDIGDRIDRLEEIAETLEDGEIGLGKAKELREEADDHLVALRDQLDVGDGDIIEIDGEDVDLDDSA